MKNKFIFGLLSIVSFCLSKNINGGEIAEALQSEAVFNQANDEKYIVTTYGCGPCVAVGGYDETNKIAFVVHFANAGEVKKCGGIIFYNILRLVLKPLEQPIKLYIRGGEDGISESENIREAIRVWMRQREDLLMKIVLDEKNDQESKSLSINSRTGEVGDYDPKKNPYARKIGQDEEMRAILSSFQPHITVAYRPK